MWRITLIETLEHLRPHFRAISGMAAHLNDLGFFRAVGHAIGGFAASLGITGVGFSKRTFSTGDFIAAMGLLLAMYAIIARSINAGYIRLLGELRRESREKFAARRRVCIGTGFVILLFAGFLGVYAPLGYGPEILNTSIMGHLCGACAILMILYGVYLAMLFFAIHYEVSKERLPSGSAGPADGSPE